MRVPLVLVQGSLIATVHEELLDTEWLNFQHELLERVSVARVSTVVIDVGSLDVVDSFASRTLEDTAAAVRLRGADTFVVGIRPAVAYAMVQLGIRFDRVRTAVDVQAALDAMASGFRP